MTFELDLNLCQHFIRHDEFSQPVQYFSKGRVYIFKEVCKLIKCIIIDVVWSFANPSK